MIWPKGQIVKVGVTNVCVLLPVIDDDWGDITYLSLTEIRQVHEGSVVDSVSQKWYFYKLNRCRRAGTSVS
jgi:hypothetical protein